MTPFVHPKCPSCGSSDHVVYLVRREENGFQWLDEHQEVVDVEETDDRGETGWGWLCRSCNRTWELSGSSAEKPSGELAPIDLESADYQCICNNCDQLWTTSKVEDVTSDGIPHFWERVEPGDIMPLGICPACESLCLPLWGWAHTQRQLVVELRQIISQLLEWEEQMGGWDASCWKTARRLLEVWTRQGSDEAEPLPECPAGETPVRDVEHEGLAPSTQPDAGMDAAA